MTLRAPLAVCLLFPVIASAHVTDDVSSWNADPWLLLLLFGSSAWYFAGWRRMQRRAFGSRAHLRRNGLLFLAAMTVLFVALISPLDAVSARLASAHMVQHMLLIIVAAPLFVLAAPLPAFLWALPEGWRKRTARGAQRSVVAASWRWLTMPLVAWLLHGAILWLWHAPALYQAALENRLLHDLEHATFLFNSLLFWWVVLRSLARSGARNGLAIILLFTTCVHGGLLAALMTFSTTAWYPAYANGVEGWSLSAVEDQQLAGLIMWLPAGITYMLAGLIVLTLWMRSLEQRQARGRPA